MSGLPLVFLIAIQCSADEPATATPVETDRIWEAEIGEGFLKDTRSIEVKLSRAFGTTINGSNVPHDLWLTQVQAGLILADVMEPEYWFGGNLEGLGQLIAGSQDKPHAAYFLAVNAGLRYHFRTGTPLVPFIAGSIGIGVSDIDDADATGKFQFNEQIGAGVRYFLDPHHAVSAEYGFWHISNGGIRQPNDGVNVHVFSLGFAWLF